MNCLTQLVSAWSATAGQVRLTSSGPVDLLLLGTGWTGSFLLPLAADVGLRTANTTREGGYGSLPFKFDPEASEEDLDQYQTLPDAKTVVIVFPIYDPKAARTLVQAYEKTRSDAADQPRFILLGSTGIYNHGPTLQEKIVHDSPTTSGPPMREVSKPHKGGKGEGKKHKTLPRSPWIDRHSPYDRQNLRAAAEDAFLGLATASPPSHTSVLCLSGLWGHGRSARRYIGAIASTKDQLRGLGSVPLVHGRDVARAILQMHHLWARGEGQRWILTNERVYDLWDLAARWGNAGEEGRNHPPRGPQPKWVQELMMETREKAAKENRQLIEGIGEEEEDEQGQDVAVSPVRALPRTAEQCGTALDSSEFWSTFEITPAVPWVD